MEPIVQAAAGIIVHPEGFLKGVRKLCDKYGVLLILDEVATGFGKTGKMFACQWENVVPDIMAVSKGITGGYLPLAATLATDEIYSAFWGGDYGSGKTFFHGHTFTGNQLGCSVALANIRLLKEKKWPETLDDKIFYLHGKLSEELSGLRHVGDIRGKGFMVGVELVKDKRTKEGFSWKDDVGRKVSRRIIEKGVFTRPLGPVLVIMPPLSISFDEIDFMVNVYRDAIVEVLGN
jgi:adenosylmethionine-8-amino-7-oxononanoate aminotransferase